MAVNKANEVFGTCILVMRMVASLEPLREALVTYFAEFVSGQARYQWCATILDVTALSPIFPLCLNFGTFSQLYLNFMNPQVRLIAFSCGI